MRHRAGLSTVQTGGTRRPVPGIKKAPGLRPELFGSLGSLPVDSGLAATGEEGEAAEGEDAEGGRFRGGSVELETVDGGFDRSDGFAGKSGEGQRLRWNRRCR